MAMEFAGQLIRRVSRTHWRLCCEKDKCQSVNTQRSPNFFLPKFSRTGVKANPGAKLGNRVGGWEKFR